MHHRSVIKFILKGVHLLKDLTKKTTLCLILVLFVGFKVLISIAKKTTDFYFLFILYLLISVKSFFLNKKIQTLKKIIYIFFNQYHTEFF